MYYLIKSFIYRPNVSQEIIALQIEFIKKLNSMVTKMLVRLDEVIEPTTLTATASFLELVRDAMERFKLEPQDTLNVDWNKMWGPYTWSFLHYTSIVMEMAKDDLELLKTFKFIVYNFKVILVCMRCHENFETKKPQILEILTNESFDAIKGIFELHQLVNKHTKRADYVYTFENFLTDYKLTYEKEE